MEAPSTADRLQSIYSVVGVSNKEKRRLARLVLTAPVASAPSASDDELLDQETALAIVARKASWDSVHSIGQSKKWLVEHGGKLLASRLGKQSGRRNRVAHPLDAQLLEDLASFEPSPSSRIAVSSDVGAREGRFRGGDGYSDRIALLEGRITALEHAGQQKQEHQVEATFTLAQYDIDHTVRETEKYTSEDIAVTETCIADCACLDTEVRELEQNIADVQALMCEEFRRHSTLQRKLAAKAEGVRQQQQQQQHIEELTTNGTRLSTEIKSLEGEVARNYSSLQHVTASSVVDVKELAAAAAAATATATATQTTMRIDGLEKLITAEVDRLQVEMRDQTEACATLQSEIAEVQVQTKGELQQILPLVKESILSFFEAKRNYEAQIAAASTYRP